jgi:lysophospholipase L1-like esterase
MRRPSLALRLTQPHLQQIAYTSAATGTPWYLAGGIPPANCLNAYQPMKAASLAASYTNLAHPGTRDAVVVGAPTWDYVKGWIGDGVASSLRTGLTSSQAWKSVIVRYSGVSGYGLKGLWGVSSGFGAYLMPRAISGSTYYGYPNELQKASWMDSGIIAMSGQKAYRDNVDEGLNFNAFTAPSYEVYMLSMGARYYIDACIQAIAFYDIDITSYLTALYTAMNALDGIKTSITMTSSDFQDTATPTTENRSDSGTYLKTSMGARVKVSTNARLIKMEVYNDIHTNYSGFADIGIRSAGADMDAITVPAMGTTRKHVHGLGAAGSKTVELMNGLQSYYNTALHGTYLCKIEFDGAATIVHDSPEGRIIFYGDSIISGANASNSPLQGAPQIVRNAYAGAVQYESYGSRSLKVDCQSEVNRTAFAQHLAVQFGEDETEQIIWLAIGTNDYGTNAWNAADFGTAYADLLDKIHTELPDAVIYCQTPIPRGTETANSFGNTLGDYRTQISTAQAARSAYCTLVDGTAIMGLGDLDTDNLHPTVAGQAKYGAAIKTALGLE